MKSFLFQPYTRNRFIVHFIVLAAFLCCIAMNGCSKVTLVPSGTETLMSVASEDQFCLDDAVEDDSTSRAEVIKLMFVIDISGSNGRTDPLGKRFDYLRNFVTGLSQREKPYEYGLIYFQHGYDTLGMRGFTGDADKMLDALSKREKIKRGETFEMAREAIEEDSRNSRLFSKDRYIIFFISDGRISDSRVNEAEDLVNEFNNVYVSSAYYGPEDEISQARLEKMARVGKGSFANFEIGETWSLDDLLLVHTSGANVIPWTIKEFLVYNLNAGFCMDGNVGVDSDMDGMCDRDEIAMNNVYATELAEEGKSFDPANRFSFGDGYGDYFHWLRFRYPGKILLACEDRSDEDFDLLTACEESEIERYTENELYHGDPEVFDTDRDGVIDGIETFVYFSSENTGGATRYTAALDPTNLSDNIDGEESVLAQIRKHKNPWILDSSTTAYDTRLTSAPMLQGACYTFSQSQLPLYDTLEVKSGNTLAGLEHSAGENSVLVYYIQVPQEVPGSTGILKHSIQKLSSEGAASLNSGLKVGAGTFSVYIPRGNSSPLGDLRS